MAPVTPQAPKRIREIFYCERGTLCIFVNYKTIAMAIAKGGESFHNYGLAIDVVPMDKGKANYNADWKKIGEIGTSHGVEWGGNFKNLIDNPHFQMPSGQTIKQLQLK